MKHSGWVPVRGVAVEIDQCGAGHEQPLGRGLDQAGKWSSA